MDGWMDRSSKNVRGFKSPCELLRLCKSGVVSRGGAPCPQQVRTFEVVDFRKDYQCRWYSQYIASKIRLRHLQKSTGGSSFGTWQGSFMYRIKKVLGPNTDSCGTPQAIWAVIVSPIGQMFSSV